MMDIFEAIELLGRAMRNPQEYISKMSVSLPSSRSRKRRAKPLQHLTDEQRRWLVAYKRLKEAERVICHYEAYSSLTPEEGHRLALEALALFDEGTSADRYKYVPQQVLAQLADNVAGSLHGLYPQFLARDLHWSDESLFREADPLTRDRIISQLEAGDTSVYRREDLLCALAWIGDETAQAAFWRWKQHPPSWDWPSTSPGWILSPPSPEDFTLQAGWELTPEGRRRDLYYQDCYSLVSLESAEKGDILGPIGVSVPHEATCGWCDRQLLTLFDIDLRDPRLAFLAAQGERLRIALCPNCSLQGQKVFTDVDVHGLSHWSAVNGERPDLLELYPEEVFPQRPVVLGPRRRTPYERGGQQLGGCAEWVKTRTTPIVRFASKRCSSLVNMNLVPAILRESSMPFFVWIVAKRPLGISRHKKGDH